MKKLMAVLAIASLGALAHADVIAAWDFDFLGGSGSNSPLADWTSLEPTAGATSTVNYTGDIYLGDGSITLTEDSGAGVFGAQVGVAAFQTNAIPLLEADVTTIRDGYYKVAPSFTLSGLVVGEDYRLQITGAMKDTNPGNITLTIGGATADLFPSGNPPGTDTYAAYSTYADFTATATSMTASGTMAGNLWMSGLIVEAVPEPATMGLVAVFGSCLLFIRRRMMK